jgi:RecA-family ATPase
MNAPTLSFPPMASLTPAMAQTEFAKARYFLSNRADGLLVLSKLAQRYSRAQQHGCLNQEADIVGRLWEAAETSGLIEAHGEETTYNVMMSAIQAAEDRPNEDADKARPIAATSYTWKEPDKIARREWIYGNLLIRKFVTATVSPGGVGKSSLIAVETLAKVSGKDLLGVAPVQPLRVWLWNLEDPQEETERKIQAAALHYRLAPDDIGGRLFVDSGRDQPLVIATATRTGAMIARPVVDALTAEIIDRKIDVLTIDPFVSCHEVGENDNTAMDMIVKEWGRVADRGNCAVHLVDHTRKMGGTESEVTVESSRGAKSKTDACRVVRAVNRMSKEEGERAGVENHRLYFRTYNDKANLQPPADKSDWFKLASGMGWQGRSGGAGDGCWQQG